MSKPLTATVDAGLAGLGLACRTFAGVGICIAAAGAVLVPLVGGSAGSNPLIWLWVVTAMIRTGLHLVVGEHALRRAPSVDKAALNYLVSAIVHTGIGIAWLTKTGAFNGGAALFILGLLVVSLAWPITIYFVTHRPALRAAFAAAETFDSSLVPADRGINSAAVLLIGFSTSMLGLPLIIIGSLLAQAGPPAPSYYAVLITCVFFIARGIYAFDLGVRTHFGRLAPTDFRRRLGVYRALAIGTLIALFAALLSIDTARQLLGRSPFIGLIALSSLVASTWIWPHVLGKFASQLDREDATEEFEPPVTTASDAGAVTLGQYILYFGWLSLGFNLMGRSAMSMVPQLKDIPGLGSFFGDSSVVSVVGLLGVAAYIGVGLALLTLKGVTRLVRPLLAVWLASVLASLVFTLTSGDPWGSIAASEVIVAVMTVAFSVGGLLALLTPILRRSRKPIGTAESA